MSQPSQFDPGGPKAGQFWAFFFPALTANVGFWATLSLNIPDFSRYARSQRDQVLGQALGLPTTMGLYSFIGVAVTSATIIIYGQAIWDPVVLLSRVREPGAAHRGGSSGSAWRRWRPTSRPTWSARPTTSPTSGRAGSPSASAALITGVVGILIQPWRLVADPTGYIFKWLVAYSSLLGAVGGVLIADYFLVRRTRLDLRGLFQGHGPYWYTGGFHVAGLLALTAGVIPCVPGFLAAIGLIETAPFWTDLYHYAWFISFGISFVMYTVLVPGG